MRNIVVAETGGNSNRRLMKTLSERLEKQVSGEDLFSRTVCVITRKRST